MLVLLILPLYLTLVSDPHRGRYMVLHTFIFLFSFPFPP